MTSAKSNPAPNVRIEALRYLAATLVVVLHASFIFKPDIPRTTGNVFRTWFAHGESGVALFLVLSGFLFGRIAFADPSRELIYWRFVQNRVARIVPLLTVLLLVGTSLYRERLDGAFWLSAITLSFESESIRSLDVFGPLWTIGVEFKFYLLFPLMVRAFGTRMRMWLGALAVVVVLRAITVYGIDPAWEVYNYCFLGRFDQILMGVLLALVFERLRAFGGRLLPVVGLGAGIVGMDLLFLKVDPWLTPHDHFFETIYPSCEALGWVVILYSVVAFPLSARPVERFFGRLGQWSYSMYLLHIMVLRTVHVDHRFVDGDDELNMVVKALVCAVPAATLLGALTYTIVEAPFLRMRVPYLRKKGDAEKPSKTPGTVSVSIAARVRRIADGETAGSAT